MYDMLDQIKFIEMCKDIVEIGKAKNNFFTKEEIYQFFSEVKLTEEQLKHIYAYLFEHNIKIDGVVSHRENMKESTEQEEAEELEDSQYVKMYLDDISYYNRLTPEEMKETFHQWKNNREMTAKNKLLGHFLSDVIQIAREYKKYKISMEDLIQEGNIGLLHALDSLTSLSDTSVFTDFILAMIRQEMEHAIDETMDTMDWTETILAKINLIREASNYLAEDLGRVATLKELSEYTKLQEEEIEKLVDLSFDGISLGEGE